MVKVQCNVCEAVLNESHNCAEESRTPCPKCGSLARKFNVVIEDTVSGLDGIGLKARHPDSSRPFYESFAKPDESKKTGKLMHKERIIDRDNDRYFEQVKDYDTGEVVHHCDEPLTKHTGHGDDKKQ